MATFVQGKSALQFSATTTVAATLAGCAAGNNIRVYVLWDASSLTVSSVSDGTAYTRVGSNLFGANTFAGAIYFRPNITSGSHTVTATFSANLTEGAILIEEWSGDNATTSAGDGSNGTLTAVGSPGPVSAGSLTTTVDGDDIWCPLFCPQGAGPPTVGSGLTIAYNNADSTGFWSEHEAQATAGAINPGWTSGTSQNDLYVAVAAFKAAAAAASKTPYNPWPLWAPALAQ